MWNGCNRDLKPGSQSWKPLTLLPGTIPTVCIPVAPAAHVWADPSSQWASWRYRLRTIIDSPDPIVPALMQLRGDWTTFRPLLHLSWQSIRQVYSEPVMGISRRRTSVGSTHSRTFHIKVVNEYLINWDQCPDHVQYLWHHDLEFTLKIITFKLHKSQTCPYKQFRIIAALIHMNLTPSFPTYFQHKTDLWFNKHSNEQYRNQQRRGLKIFWSRSSRENAFSSRQVSCLELFTAPDKWAAWSCSQSQTSELFTEPDKWAAWSCSQSQTRARQEADIPVISYWTAPEQLQTASEWRHVWSWF
jgi:hypothetical protein